MKRGTKTQDGCLEKRGGAAGAKRRTKKHAKQDAGKNRAEKEETGEPAEGLLSKIGKMIAPGFIVRSVYCDHGNAG